MLVTKVVVEPSGKTDVIVTGTEVVERLSDGAGALVLSVAPAVGALVLSVAPAVGALVLSVAPAVGADEFESSSGVVVCRMRDECAVQVRGSSVRTATDVVSEVAGGVSVADVIGEVVVESVETGIELAPEVVVMPASVDTVCPSVGPSVWPGGATEPVVESLLGAAITESFPPPVDGGGGGVWPDGRTTYVQTLSSRTDWAPSPPVIGVSVTWHVCVIVPT